METVKSADQLHIFFESHKSELTEQDYQSLISKMQSQISTGGYHDIRNWCEDKNRLEYSAEYEHWVGHDDTEHEECRIQFVLVESPVNVEWISNDNAGRFVQDIPCKGVCLLSNNSSRTGDSWSYKNIVDKEYYVNRPYGMNGIWKLSVYVCEER